MSCRVLSGYDFKYLGKFSDINGVVHKYKFLSSKTNKSYIVEFEYIYENFYGVKFYLFDYKKSKNRYKMLSNLNEASMVISTCLLIGVDFFHKFPDASFGFVGERKEDEDVRCTKRYRVYKRLVESYVSSALFVHYSLEEYSAYCLINRNIPDTDVFMSDLKSFMRETFVNFDQ